MSTVYKAWRKNLYAIFIAELIVLMGFSFVNPFLPLFIQELGSYTNREAAFWAGMSTAGHGLAMFISGPFWGILADRWGRKPMVLRAQFSSALILASLGLVPNVYWIVGLRTAQGVLSGTVTAASAMVAAGTPREKMPFAMGLLMVAVFGGTTFGPLLGGFMADTVGFKATFYITGALLFCGGLIVLFFTKEEFKRPAREQAASLKSLLRLAKSRQMFPLLMTLSVLPLGPQMIQPIIPVFIREIDPKAMAATASGIAFSLMGVMATASSFIAGRMGGRITLKKMLVISCMGIGLLYLPPIWAGTVTQLLFFIALTGLFKGGLMTSSNALVGLSVSQSQQGIAYGAAQGAHSLGNGLGPLIGGALASLLGFRSVFGVGAGLFMLIGMAVNKLLPEVSMEKS